MKNLSMKQAINIEGTDKVVYLDFSDKKLGVKLLKLIKRYQNIEKEIKERFETVDATVTDELEKLLAYSELEIEILEDFRRNVDDVFSGSMKSITTELYGEGVTPSVERYFELFEELLPAIKVYKIEEEKRLQSLNAKYGLNRIK